MKLLHVADLHIGKVVNEFSMLEDQKFILEQILQTAIAQKVEAILIAGDLYDRSIPPADAVAVFDHFLTDVRKEGIKVIMIAGNHDSQERVGFLQNVLSNQGIFISGIPKESLTRVCLNEKEEGIGKGAAAVKTEVVLLPFGKPSQVHCSTSEEAVRKLLSGYWEEESSDGKQKERKNRILLTHYFVTDCGREPELSDSESTIHVGSLDNVEASVFEGFDYVALGHIHKKQQIGSRPVYYSGSPLKYSFGEAGSTKGMLLVTMGEEGLYGVEELPLKPLREMRKIKGTLQELLKQGREEGSGAQDYVQACLTDEGELIDPMETLRSVYPNAMQILRADREEIRTEFELGTSALHGAVKRKDAGFLFREFYEEVKEQEMTEEQKQYMVNVIREAKEKAEG